jgi:hypothetical protein|tara:strand:- start:6035 stop:6616 length:582 start_codon:yes stop_codon:yes gene_type:complete
MKKMTLTKVGTQGGYQWINYLRHAEWTVDEDIVRKAFPLKEAEIIIDYGKDGINVFTTYFHNPKRKWVFYPHGLYEYCCDNIDNPDIKYAHTGLIPKYNIYESVFRDGSWQKIGKIGYCLPRTSKNDSNFLLVPVNFKSNRARRKYYQLSKQKIKNKFRYMNRNDMSIIRNYYIFDIDDDYIIKDKARLMYVR